MHGGNVTKVARELGCSPNEIIDFSSNLNALGPPDTVFAAIQAASSEIIHYPDAGFENLINTVSEYYQVCADRVLVGNGVSSLLFEIIQSLDEEELLMPIPCYSDYIEAASAAKKKVKLFETDKDNFQIDLDKLREKIRPGLAIVLGNPSNPSGSFISIIALIRFIQSFPNNTFIIDEAFAPFVGERLEEVLPNIIIFRSITKIFAIPGIRIGFAITGSKFIHQFNKRTAWPIGSIEERVAIACMKDHEYLARSIEFNHNEREWLKEQLSRLNDYLRIYHSHANYFLIELKQHSAIELQSFLLKGFKILIRDCSNYQALDSRFIRIAIKKREYNEKLLEGFDSFFNKKKPRSNKGMRKRPLMILGTGSSVGKSVLVAAFSRILTNEGLDVAPFKAQNMSLNSYVTLNGEEISRSIALQAKACKKDVDVLMNPILLKPTSQIGSQLILMGKPQGFLGSKDFTLDRTKLWQNVEEAFHELSNKHDVIVIEGAGSPCEVNLKPYDIVNLRVAKLARAASLLVSNIDRGGSFASLIGHMQTMTIEERNLIEGFVLNKFRGDSSLLKDAIDITRDYTGKDVLGIIPYVEGLNLPEEDAFFYEKKNSSNANIKIGVLAYPSISNFTDFDCFYAEEDVQLGFIRETHDLTQYDAIILPGSKNVVSDLYWLRQNEFEALLNDCRNQEVEIIGICGGMQMLGNNIVDTDHVESANSNAVGLGFLDISTTMEHRKTLSRVETRHLKSEQKLTGYEIHHGVSKVNNAKPMFENDSLGYEHVSLPIWGTYIHGAFDSDHFRLWFLNQIRIRKNIAVQTEVTKYEIESSIDRLADVVAENLEKDKIYKAMRL